MPRSVAESGCHITTTPCDSELVSHLLLAVNSPCVVLASWGIYTVQWSVSVWVVELIIVCYVQPSVDLVSLSHAQHVPSAEAFWKASEACEITLEWIPTHSGWMPRADPFWGHLHFIDNTVKHLPWSSFMLESPSSSSCMLGVDGSSQATLYFQTADISWWVVTTWKFFHKTRTRNFQKKRKQV